VEIRTLDLNPFEPLGIAREQMCLTELFVLYCLLDDSAPIDAREQDEIDQRELIVAWEGRRPGLELPRGGATTTLTDWSDELLDGLDGIAELLDGPAGRYRDAVAAARAAAAEPAATLSAQVLDGLRQAGNSFFAWAFALAERHHHGYLAHAFEPDRLAQLETAARQSLREAEALETADSRPFEQFLAAELAPGESGRPPDASPVL
jgi:glutamate--cysteine ligase